MGISTRQARKLRKLIELGFEDQHQWPYLPPRPARVKNHPAYFRTYLAIRGNRD